MDTDLIFEMDGVPTPAAVSEFNEAPANVATTQIHTLFVAVQPPPALPLTMNIRYAEHLLPDGYDAEDLLSSTTWDPTGDPSDIDDQEGPSPAIPVTLGRGGFREPSPSSYLPIGDKPWLTPESSGPDFRSPLFLGSSCTTDTTTSTEDDATTDAAPRLNRERPVFFEDDLPETFVISLEYGEGFWDYLVTVEDTESCSLPIRIMIQDNGVPGIDPGPFTRITLVG